MSHHVPVRVRQMPRGSTCIARRDTAVLMVTVCGGVADTERNIIMSNWLLSEDEYLAQVAHDMRNPISAILGLVQLCRQEEGA